MEISWARFRLEFHHPFRLATGTRTGTDSVFVRISLGPFSGYGEATLPPYLTENTESVISYLRSVDLSAFDPIQDRISIREEIHRKHLSDYFARCALEEAYLHLIAQLGVNEFDRTGPAEALSTYTLGMGDEEETLQKIIEAHDFPILKIKLADEKNRRNIEFIRKHTDKPLCIDANQGWHDVNESIAFSKWLRDQHVLLIEQPFAANDLDKHFRLKEKSALPVIADESVQTLGDLRNKWKCFDGVNIKLLKCGGAEEAEKMLVFANENKLFSLIGCMSESSCGVFHAAKFRFNADLMDLDGPCLIKNDPFSGYTLTKGKIHTTELKLIAPLQFDRS